MVNTGKPVGITLVAVTTLLVSLALCYLFLIFVAVSSVGMGPGLLFNLQNLPTYLPLFLSAFSFFSSVMVLWGATTKYLWYCLVMFWIVFLAFFFWYYTHVSAWRYMAYWEGGDYQWISIARILFLPSPFIYALGCLAYFQTRTAREYFVSIPDKLIENYAKKGHHANPELAVKNQIAERMETGKTRKQVIGELLEEDENS